THEVAKKIACYVWDATGYRFNYKKRAKSRQDDAVATYSFYCAQLEGEATKQRLVDELGKRRVRMTMDWFPCEGWLIVTVDEANRDVASIRITHHRCHVPYTDISISEDVAQLIEEMKNLPASKVFTL
ncbi:hypothetical protein K443DRAFT_48283, partial [Laccaria amethystina LaAM-08-1]